MAETMSAPPDYFTGEQLIAALGCDLRVTVQNILDEVVRATLLQTLISDWPAYLIHAIRGLAEDHNYPEQFLQEMAVQMQVLATAYEPAEEGAMEELHPVVMPAG